MQLFDIPDRPGRSHDWISDATTRQKEDDFRDLIGGIHVPACAGIAKTHGRPGDPPYTFIDFHAGPGRLRDNTGNAFDGSPLIAINALRRSGLAYETFHFEKDPSVCAELEAALSWPENLMPESMAVNEPFARGVRHWLGSTPAHVYRYGMAYADPWKDTEGKPVPVEEFNLIAEHSPKMDLLVYIAANSHYKRSGLAAKGHRVADDIDGVRKRFKLIRRQAGAEQFTFILFSDFPFGDWRKRGFYRLGTPDGDAILRDINYTRDEVRYLGAEALW